MQVVKEKITKAELSSLARKEFGDLVKAVVDVEREIMAIDAQMHADGEALLLQEGCEQKNLWGINLYPEKEEADWIEFDSVINIRPTQNNRSRGVEDQAIQEKIKNIVMKLIQ